MFCKVILCVIILIKYHLRLCSKVIFWFGATNCTKPFFFGFFGIFLMQANFFWPGISTWSGRVVTQQRDSFYLRVIFFFFKIYRFLAFLNNILKLIFYEKMQCQTFFYAHKFTLSYNLTIDNWNQNLEWVLWTFFLHFSSSSQGCYTVSGVMAPFL